MTLATLLKYSFRGNHDVLAMAAEKNSKETQKMLYEWAAQIILVDEEFRPYVPTEHRWKVIIVPIGQDKWGMSMHPDLVPLAVKLLIEAGFEPKLSAQEILAKGAKYSIRRGSQ